MLRYSLAIWLPNLGLSTGSVPIAQLFSNRSPFRENVAVSGLNIPQSECAQPRNRDKSKAIRKAKDKYFTQENQPASTMVGVSALVMKELLLEIEATAVIEG